MRIVSLLVFGVAIFLGIIAVVGVRGMIANNQAIAPVIVDAPTSTVVVARQQLEFGTELQPELLREISWASEDKPEGSFTTINDIMDGERRVALRSIAPGELVLKDRISGFGGRATLSQIIEEGQRAVTIRVNDVSGAGGFILPGDRVDVLMTIQPGKGRLGMITDVILDDIRVLAMDQIADENQEGAIVAKAATLEVDPEDAQRIALASSIGSLSLTLRNFAASAVEEELDGEREPLRTIRYRDLGPDKKAAPVSRAAAPSPFTTMRVTRGTEASNASVLKDRTRPAQQSSSVYQPNTPVSQLNQAPRDLASNTAGSLSAPAGE